MEKLPRAGLTVGRVFVLAWRLCSIMRVLLNRARTQCMHGVPTFQPDGSAVYMEGKRSDGWMRAYRRVEFFVVSSAVDIVVERVPSVNCSCACFRWAPLRLPLMLCCRDVGHRMYAEVCP